MQICTFLVLVVLGKAAPLMLLSGVLASRVVLAQTATAGQAIGAVSRALSFVINGLDAPLLGRPLLLSDTAGQVILDDRTSVVIQYRQRTLLTQITDSIAFGYSAVSDIYCSGLTGRSDATTDALVRLYGLMDAAGSEALMLTFNLLATDALIARHLVRKGWLGCMIDRLGQFVQRTLKNDARMGQFGGKELIVAACRATGGCIHGVSSNVDV